MVFAFMTRSRPGVLRPHVSGLLGLLLLSGSAFSRPTSSPETASELAVGGLFRVRFVTRTEAAERLGRRDGFIRAMRPLDRAIRIEGGGEASEDEYLRAVSEAAREWDRAARTRVGEALLSLVPRLEPLGLPWPETIDLVATSGAEEGGAAYCRDGAIFLPERQVNRARSGLPRLLVHELFHILSSHRRDVRRAVHGALGYARAEIEYPESLARRLITNPDAAGVDVVTSITVAVEGSGPSDVVAAPVLLYDAPEGASDGPFFRHIVHRLLVVERTSTAPDGPAASAPEVERGRFYARLRDGSPWLIDPGENESFYRSIGRNTGYVIHPEEIAADNFVHLVFGTGDLASPGVVDRLRHALGARPDAAVREAREAKASGREDLLDAIERRAFRFFVDHQDIATGLVLDRASNQTPIEDRTVASIAAAGFGLAVFPIAASRGFIPEDEARERCRRLLRYARDELGHERGFFWHFADLETGERLWKCEASSIDTALFLLGALFAGASFPESEVDPLAKEIFARVDWEWLRTDGGTKPESLTLSMGWRPEHGFLGSRWDHYSELLGLYVLALGSPAHPIPEDSWTAWRRPEVERAGLRVIGGDLPLFVHQYSHVFIDFRARDDHGVDWHENSVRATALERDVARELASRYRTFADFHGISACDGPRGYRAYAPKSTGGDAPDGTVCPAAAITSIIFDPDPVVADLERWVDHPRFEKIFGVYGFTDGFNFDEGWVGDDVIGITLGALILAIENHRSGLVWERMRNVPSIRAGLHRAGLVREP